MNFENEETIIQKHHRALLDRQKEMETALKERSDVLDFNTWAAELSSQSSKLEKLTVDRDQEITQRDQHVDLFV